MVATPVSQLWLPEHHVTGTLPNLFIYVALCVTEEMMTDAGGQQCQWCHTVHKQTSPCKLVYPFNDVEDMSKHSQSRSTVLSPALVRF
jgi:hypothetical protein